MTYEEQLESVKRNGSNIRHVDNPSDDICFIAVSQNPYLIRHDKNESVRNQLKAFEMVLKYPQYFNIDAVMHYIEIPCKELIELILEYDIDSHNARKIYENASEEQKIYLKLKYGHFLV